MFDDEKWKSVPAGTWVKLWVCLDGIPPWRAVGRVKRAEGPFMPAVEFEGEGKLAAPAWFAMVRGAPDGSHALVFGVEIESVIARIGRVALTDALVHRSAEVGRQLRRERSWQTERLPFNLLGLAPGPIRPSWPSEALLAPTRKGRAK